MTIAQAIAAAVQHQRAGQLTQAEALYRQVLTAEPNNPDALHLLGLVAYQIGRFDVAKDLIERAIAIQPGAAPMHSNLGQALLALGQPEQAMAAYRKAIAVRPDYPGAYFHLGNALQAADQLDEAIDAFRQTLVWAPDDPDAHYNLANALQRGGRSNEAIAEYHQSLALRPDFAPALNNLAGALHLSGSFDEAIATYRRVIELAPDDAAAHHNLGVTLLLKGDFESGWREYDWRRSGALHVVRQSIPQPLWNGQPLDGQRILLHHEQGFGDAIQFVRYASLVAERGGKVVLQCPLELIRLFETVAGIEQIVALTDPPPEVDLQCPLLSLPAIFQTTAANIPAAVPYLHADPEEVAQWRLRLPQDGMPNLGLAWAGGPLHPNDRSRSIPMATFAPLAQVPAARFISLQKGPAATEIPASPIALADWTEELYDFAATAALLETLDLVITADTAVAHLAGALGKTVWVLLPFVPDWRWMLDRTDSPWYPSMRLFRQISAGDWNAPVQQIAEALRSR